LTKAVRIAAGINEQMRSIEFAIGRLRELTDDHPLTVRIEVKNIQECVDLLRYKLREQAKAAARAKLSAKRSSDQEWQPSLVPPA
jgi:hypothetical protein